jgi:hypothetical protein
LPVGRPLGHEVERPAGLDPPGMAAVGVGDINLIILVIGDRAAVGRGTEAVGELPRRFGQVALVPAVAVHAERVRVAADQRREAEGVGVAGPEEQAAAIGADAVDSRDVGGAPRRQVEQERVVQPSLGEAERLVLLFPGGVLGAFPAPAEDGQAAVGRPAGELGPGVGVASQLLGQDAPAGAVAAGGRRTTSRRTGSRSRGRESAPRPGRAGRCRRRGRDRPASWRRWHVARPPGWCGTRCSRSSPRARSRSDFQTRPSRRSTRRRRRAPNRGASRRLEAEGCRRRRGSWLRASPNMHHPLGSTNPYGPGRLESKGNTTL